MHAIQSADRVQARSYSGHRSTCSTRVEDGLKCIVTPKAERRTGGARARLAYFIRLKAAWSIVRSSAPLETSCARSMSAASRAFLVGVLTS